MSYDDADAVQEYAKDAMAWAAGAGIIKGKDGQNILAPQGNTNRAESAAVISDLYRNTRSKRINP